LSGATFDVWAVLVTTRQSTRQALGGTQPFGVFGAPTIEIRERLTVQRLVGETIAEHLLLRASQALIRRERRPTGRTKR